ncbi:hypothetical protein Q8F55_000642 [Vanrija albida]|uniref:C3H1-type domain-containing protein n=1 Tax=Vanrija albida TaxID=181172 RepID=A0ABR3QER7_9TREE
MSIESAAANAHPEVVAVDNKAAEQQQQQQQQELDHQQQQAQDTTGVEAAVANLAIAQPQADLHRACADGRLDDVRAILGRGLDALETLDIVTGCTPIVLAIQNGHVDVVRELLSANAVVPPPGLTMDPVMLSVLYPQPLYAPPPPFAQMGPPQFYHQPGFYPPAGAVHYPPRKESSAGAGANGAAGNAAANGAANLPPTEVAKTIPCRNFPNCKYGASCIFFHPRPQPGFFPGAPAGYYDPAAGGFVPYPAGAAGFFPGAPQFVPGASTDATATDAAAPASESTPADAAATTQHDSIPAQSPGAHVPSAVAPAFVPGAIPVPNGDAAANGGPFIGSPPAGYAIGPLSPTLIPHSPPPADAAYFATSPPQFQPFIPNGYGPGRRQSFGQQFAGGPKPFHGKKPSFSGGSKPWGPGGRPGGSSHLGQWKDGVPPPCAFFREGKCRNGEYCKFPHIDAETGQDVRHPDVVLGRIPPMPTRPPRVMRNQINGHYDPRQQHAPFPHKGANSTTVAEVPAEAEASAVAAADGADASSTKAASDKADGPASVSGSATLPPKPSGSPLPPATGRSASQPGVARVHANGVASRSHSPNGVRRGPRYPNGQANGSRSSSASGEKKPAPPQRVPRADEFPALGINGGASTPSTERREPSWGSKTAAQVLSEPAPPKPASPVSAEAEDKPAEKVVEEVTMDSDSEQDAVIVSVSTTPNPEVAKAKLAAAAASSVSFASVASAVITAAPDAAPVALKA